MKKREKELVLEFLPHFLSEAWGLDLTWYAAKGFGPLKKSDLTKKGLARLARLMPYLSLRSDNDRVMLEKNFKKESEIPAEHLVVYYKDIAEQNLVRANELDDILYEAARKADLL